MNYTAVSFALIGIVDEEGKLRMFERSSQMSRIGTSFIRPDAGKGGDIVCERLDELRNDFSEMVEAAFPVADVRDRPKDPEVLEAWEKWQENFKEAFRPS